MRASELALADQFIEWVKQQPKKKACDVSWAFGCPVTLFGRSCNRIRADGSLYEDNTLRDMHNDNSFLEVLFGKDDTRGPAGEHARTYGTLLNRLLKWREKAHASVQS